MTSLGRLAVSLPLRIEARELLHEGVSHALQLNFEALFELPKAALISIACGVCGAGVRAYLPRYS